MPSAIRAKYLDDLERLAKISQETHQFAEDDPHLWLVLDGDHVAGFGPSIFDDKDEQLPESAQGARKKVAR